MITATGLGSGLDIEGLVTQLVAAERQAPELRLNRAEASAQASLSGFGQLQSALSSFRSAVQSLGDSSLYNAIKANSSDVGKVFASATASAAPGAYDLEVNRLATRQSLASGSFADRDTTGIGTGSLTIRFGTTDYGGGSYLGFTQNTNRGALTLEIDPSNNTLQGISDAINDADAGVRASVVNDGRGYRLLLSSEFTGAENSLEISVSDDDGNDGDTLGLSRLAFNAGAANLEQTVAAEDALLSINGLSISSAENRVSDVLDGVTLDLKEVTTAPVSLEVVRDLASVESGVLGFINQFNELQRTFTGLAGYNADSGEGGILQGDFTVNAVENRIKSILRGVPAGVTGELQRLSQIGITTNADGTLSLDEAALRDALENDRDGVAALFSAVGRPSSNEVRYLGSSADTAVGEFAVNVTQPATQGQLLGASALPTFGGDDLLVDADNDKLGVKLDGIDLGVITLTQGTYSTGDSLATELQAQINAAAVSQSISARVAVSYSALSSSLTLTSTSYGESSTVEITSVGTQTAAELGLSLGAGMAGTDVAGTINGEPATGNGQLLTADEGSSAAGLQLEITAGASGELGSVSFGRGLFDLLDGALDGFLVSDGLIENRSAGLRRQVDEVSDQREALELRLETIEARYRAQFTALDTLLSQLQTTSTFLTQQLATLPGPASSSDS